ncbi:hypothetical protein FAO11_12670, partial [Klebsiella pneumoniae subsp. pneumoniae]
WGFWGSPPGPGGGPPRAGGGGGGGKRSVFFPPPPPRGGGDSAPANAANRIKTTRSSKGSTKWRRPVGCWSRTRP